jgi:hypothetical protein
MQGARRAHIPCRYSTDEQRGRMGCIGPRMPTYLWDGILVRHYDTRVKWMSHEHGVLARHRGQ